LSDDQQDGPNVTTSSQRFLSDGAVARVSRFALAIACVGSLAACQESGGNYSNARAYKPIPPEAVALMQTKDTDTHAPILIRTFKKEAELEIWKLNHKGEYVHLKTYPMCRWSGQLGPKTREGDRQVPEGFYTITPGQMNPNSAYYLSFNVGYPNAYDKAHGYTGGAIMVHGICSSAGCFSMTDEQIAEIYAITREAFGGGQRAVQLQSMPFRMTAENLAKHRFDPNMRFWKEIKEGADQFDVTKQETKVAICGKRYVFGATPVNASARLDAESECPQMQVEPELKSLVAAKQHKDAVQVAELVAKGVKPIKIVYADGGQHPDFANRVAELSRPEAIAKGPTEVPLDEKGKPIPLAVQMASAAKASKAAPTADKGVSTLAKAADAPVDKSGTPAFAPTAAAAAPAAQPFYAKWLGSKPAETPAAAEPLVVPVEPQPANVPVPPKRQAQTTVVKPQAALGQASKTNVALRARLPDGVKAYAPIDR
jgi:murein L,D-transpeptidase YafK